MSEKFWSVKAEKKNEGADIGHLYLYGPIASTTWWGDEISPKQLINDIKSLGNISELNVHIFSDGGDVFAGTAIYSILKQQKTTVNIYIEGIAASIATVIAMAGDNVYISKTGMMYFHNAMILLIGFYNANDLSSMINDLEKIKEPILTAYETKTNKLREDLSAIMDGADGGGTWYTANEAINARFADGLIPDEKDQAIAACIGDNLYMWNNIKFDLSKYPNAPKINYRSEKKLANEIKTEDLIVNVAQETSSTAAGYDDGVKAERQRIADLETILEACPECKEIINKAKNEGWDYEQTSKTVFSEKAKVNKENSEKFLAGMTADIANAGSKVNAVPAVDDTTGNDEKELQTLIKKYKDMKNGGKKNGNQA